MKRLTLLLAVLVPLATLAIPARADDKQVLCESVDHCYTQQKALNLWNAGNVQQGSDAPVKTTTVDALTGATCEDVQTDVYFLELWPWGWRRAYTYYRHARWCHKGGNLTTVSFDSWIDFGDFSFWERNFESDRHVTSGSLTGTYRYDRLHLGTKECLAKVSSFCFYVVPWIAMTLRGDGTHWVCGSDGDCYGTPPKPGTGEPA